MRDFRSEKIQPPRGFQPLELPPNMPVDLEIGCGTGWHPITYAGSNPDRLLIAIEHTRMRFEKFARRASHHEELDNLFPIHANAVAWVTHALQDKTISRIFLYYPNPYPKRGDQSK